MQNSFRQNAQHFYIAFVYSAIWSERLTSASPVRHARSSVRRPRAVWHVRRPRTLDRDPGVYSGRGQIDKILTGRA